MIVHHVYLFISSQRKFQRDLLIKLGENKLMIEDKTGILQELKIEVQSMFLVSQIMNQLSHASESSHQ